MLFITDDGLQVNAVTFCQMMLSVSWGEKIVTKAQILMTRT